MERYQISLNAVGLQTASGFFRKSSTYAKVKVVSGSREGTELGKTECVPSSSPDWSKIFFLEFDATEVTSLEVSICSKVEGGKDSLIDKATFEATTVFQEPGRTASEQIGQRATSRYALLAVLSVESG